MEKGLIGDMKNKKAEFLEAVQSIEKLDNEKKATVEAIKLKVEQFSESLDIPKKIFKKAVKEYLKFQEDQGGYIVEKDALDNLLNSLIK